MKNTISSDIGEQIIQKLKELNKKLDKLLEEKDEQEEFSNTPIS